MPHLEPLNDRATLSPEAQTVYDEIVGNRGGMMPGPSGVMLHSPRFAHHYAGMGTVARTCSLKPNEREVAIMVAARALGNDYIWAAHSAAGLRNGVSQQTIDVINSRSPVDALDADEALIIRLGRELVADEAVTDATFDAAIQRYGKLGYVELVATMAQYAMTHYIITAAGLTPPPDSQRLVR